MSIACLLMSGLLKRSILFNFKEYLFSVAKLRNQTAVKKNLTARGAKPFPRYIYGLLIVFLLMWF
jgi:hypothetical protein